MASILVTGGTGALGWPTVGQLRAAGHQVRVLSRKPGPDRIVGDLTTGAGLAAAADGVDVVVHLATAQGKRDIDQARNLLAAAPPAAHLVFMSIAGVDRIPMAYYQHKFSVEGLVAESGRPYTIQRATQFHTLIDRVFRTERFFPALLAPAIPLQPIAVEDVAVRLAELVAQPPVNGRAPDIGGPEQRPVPELAQVWKDAQRLRRPVLPVRLPGRVFRAFAAGEAMVDGTPAGRITFAEYLA